MLTYVALVLATVIAIGSLKLKIKKDEGPGFFHPLTPAGRVAVALLLASLAVGVASQKSQDTRAREQRMQDSAVIVTDSQRYALNLRKHEEQRTRDSLQLYLDSAHFSVTLENLHLQLTKQDSVLVNTGTQLQRQAQSLQMLRRTLTRFDRLGFQIRFRYPLHDAVYATYVDSVRHHAQAVLTQYVLANGRGPVRSDGSVEYVNYDTLWSVYGRWDDQGDSIVVERVDLGPEAPLARRSNPQRVIDLRDILGQASLHLSFYRRDPALGAPDLKLRVLAWNPATRDRSLGTHTLAGADPAAVRLLFDFKAGVIEQTLYTSTFERSDAGVVNEIMSLDDLVGSTLVILREDLTLNGVRVGEQARMEGFEILWGPDLSNRIVLDACRLGWRSAPYGTRRVFYRFAGDEPGLRTSLVERGERRGASGACTGRGRS
jgi:hypothetical protein